MRKIAAILLIIVLCSCNLGVVEEHYNFRGRTYQNYGETIYFDNITHHLRQLVYMGDTAKFALVGSQGGLEFYLRILFSGGYAVYVNFPVVSEDNDGKIGEIIAYYYDKVGVSEDKTLVINIRMTQREFYFDSLYDTMLLGYFTDNTYKTLKIAIISNGEVVGFRTFAQNPWNCYN